MSLDVIKMFASIEEHIDLTKIGGHEIRKDETGFQIGTFDMYGKMQGNCVYICLDEDEVIFVQQGTFKNGLLVGFGMTYFALSQRKYVGEHVNSIMSGIGKMIYSDGRVEEGIFAEGHFVKNV